MSWAALWARNPDRVRELAKGAARLPPVVRHWTRPEVRRLEAGAAEGGRGWFPDAGVGPGS